ncbi:MAG: hypothetical protein ACJA1F_001871 [Paracoccaceae bacterium]|jgi:hypothetical protein|tara:strand:+ start:669 stop:905 length:237 start_codon:yes stop_codon:yes gene_type:complete
MTSMKTVLSATAATLGALVVVPLVAFFGLMMLGLAFGVSLIAVAMAAVTVRQAHTKAEAAGADRSNEAAPADAAMMAG